MMNQPDMDFCTDSGVASSERRRTGAAGPALTLAALVWAAPLAAQDIDPPECDALMGDVRFCAGTLGLTGTLDEGETAISGSFFDMDDPDATLVGVGTIATGLPVPADMDAFRDAYDQGYLDEIPAFQTREIVESFSDIRAGVPMLRTVRYSFNVDYGRVLAFSYLYLPGLTVEVLTIEGGIGPTFTEAHLARHEAALGALLVPATAADCVALTAGQDLCPGGSPWAGLVPLYLTTGVVLADAERDDRTVLIAHAGRVPDTADPSEVSVGTLHEEFTSGGRDGLTVLADLDGRGADRAWRVSDFRLDLTQQQARIGRGSTSVSEDILIRLETTWPDPGGAALPPDFAEAHDAVRDGFVDRRSRGDGWTSAGAEE